MTSPSQKPHPSTWIRAYAQVQVATDADIIGVLRDAQQSLREDMVRIIGSGRVGDRLKYEQMARMRQAVLAEQAAALRRIGNVVQARRVEAAMRSIQLGADLDAYIFDSHGQTQMARELLRNLSYGLRQTAQVALARTELSATTLAQRIYNVDVGLGSRIDQRITSLLAQGKTAREFAAEAQDWFNPDTPGGVRYAAMRLARSEINNSFHAVAVQQVQDKPWVLAMHWYLSGSHPKPDLCDEYANEDRYQMGQGVFPKREVPRKPHPHCYCYVTPVQVDEEEFLDGVVSGRYDEHIQQQRQIALAGGHEPHAPHSHAFDLDSDGDGYTLGDARKEVAGWDPKFKAEVKESLARAEKAGTMHPRDLLQRQALGGKPPTQLEMQRAHEHQRAALARKAQIDAERAARKAARAAGVDVPATPVRAKPPTPPPSTPAPVAPVAKATGKSGARKVDVHGHKVSVRGASDSEAARITGRMEHQHTLAPKSFRELKTVEVKEKIRAPGAAHPTGLYTRSTKKIDMAHECFIHEGERHGAEGVFDHEFGHHLHYIVRGSAREQEIWDAVSGHLGLPPVPERPWERADWMASHRTTLRAKTTAYGASDPDELLAEIWRMYSTGHAPADIKAIGEVIRSVVEGAI